MPFRIKDIARDLGVSVLTMSKILRNQSGVGDSTRQRVLSRLRELKYEPNLAAQRPLRAPRYLAGLVVPDLLHPFFAEIGTSLSRALRQHACGLIVASTEEDPDLEEQLIGQLLARGLDMLFVAPCRPNLGLFQHVERKGTPYVLIDRTIPGLSANYVGVDDRAAGFLATKHLIEIGCRRIAHIQGPATSPGLQRAEGYRNALAKYDIKFRDSFQISQPKGDVETKQQGVDGMEGLLTLQPVPDGVFCFNDPIAMGAMNAALYHGLRIPSDIAIIGCGNLHYDDSLRIPLSSINQNSRLIGEQAARLAFRIIHSPAKLPPKRLVLEPELVVRLSTERGKSLRARPTSWK
ncbi:MAG: LacI family DNA-binding transcriptional regulator [Candidatus Acidiferrales bacterium]